MVGDGLIAAILFAMIDIGRGSGRGWRSGPNLERTPRFRNDQTGAEKVAPYVSPRPLSDVRRKALRSAS
jgi:hypothetical protein